jgi:uncharacterized metal-binding protein YceD (DUF177 family)
MKVIVSQIPQKGRDFVLDAHQDWVMAIFNNVLKDLKFDPTSIQGKMAVRKQDPNVVLSGSVDFMVSPQCARCGADLTSQHHVDFYALYAPLHENQHSKTKETEEEEIELTAQDLEFAFYENDEIDASALLNDEVALELPYNYYCDEKQAATCEINSRIHLKEWTSETESATDPRWEALKSIKITKQ